MRGNLIRAALMAGLFLDAGAAPVLANAWIRSCNRLRLRSPERLSRLTDGAFRAPSSSAPASADSTSSCRTIRRSSTASASDGQGLPGPGATHIGYKREWPDWTPPPQMLRHRPDLPRHMDGGPDNPLGARAMYLAGTLYRIHGSNEPDTIGQAVSSGCIRMTNQDVIDLYERARVGARVVVTR